MCSSVGRLRRAEGCFRSSANLLACSSVLLFECSGSGRIHVHRFKRSVRCNRREVAAYCFWLCEVKSGEFGYLWLAKASSTPIN